MVARQPASGVAHLRRQSPCSSQSPPRTAAPSHCSVPPEYRPPPAPPETCTTPHRPKQIIFSQLSLLPSVGRDMSSTQSLLSTTGIQAASSTSRNLHNTPAKQMIFSPAVSISANSAPTLSGTRNEYQPKCVDAVRLGSKSRYGSCHLWIDVWVAGKTV